MSLEFFEDAKIKECISHFYDTKNVCIVHDCYLEAVYIYLNNIKVTVTANVKEIPLVKQAVPEIVRERFIKEEVTYTVSAFIKADIPVTSGTDITAETNKLRDTILTLQKLTKLLELRLNKAI